MVSDVMTDCEVPAGLKKASAADAKHTVVKDFLLWGGWVRGRTVQRWISLNFLERSYCYS